MKRTTNRRLWSTPVRRGEVDVLEFSSPTGGVVRTITKLEIAGQPLARTEAASYLMSYALSLAVTTAKDQHPHG